MKNTGQLLVLMLVFSVALLSARCSVEPEEGQFKCLRNDDCPSGWVCNHKDGLCYSDESEFPSDDTDSNSD